MKLQEDVTRKYYCKSLVHWPNCFLHVVASRAYPANRWDDQADRCLSHLVCADRLKLSECSASWILMLRRIGYLNSGWSNSNHIGPSNVLSLLWFGRDAFYDWWTLGTHTTPGSQPWHGFWFDCAVFECPYRVAIEIDSVVRREMYLLCSMSNLHLSRATIARWLSRILKVTRPLEFHLPQPRPVHSIPFS